LGNVSGLFNLLFFVLLLTYLCAIFAAQLVRGDLPEFTEDGDINPNSFYTVWYSFLGMYQVFSSEGWTSILYEVQAEQREFGVGWISAIFFIGWFILANFIVLNMFIAVIQENFDVSEDEKRMYQVKAFLQRKEIGVQKYILSLTEGRWDCC
jgi:voltage-dependent calcium channel